MSWDKLTPIHPHEMIPRATKKARNQSRLYEKKHPATSFSIPAPLMETARAIREQVLSCAEFDEAGHPRLSLITADMVANVLISWSLARVADNPALIPVSPTARSRVGLTAHAAAWDAWNVPPPFPKSTRGHKKGQNRQKKFNLSYRIPEFMEKQIREIAERTGVPIGEVFLRLLQLGLDDYKAMKFRIAVQPDVIYRTATWEKVSDE